MPVDQAASEAMKRLGLNKAQLEVLDALCGSTLRALPANEAAQLAATATAANNNNPVAVARLAQTTANDVNVRSSLANVLSETVPHFKLALLRFGLSALRFPAAAFALTGVRLASFLDYSPDERDKAIFALSTSSFSDLRMIATIARTLVFLFAFGSKTISGDDGSQPPFAGNPLWEAIGFEGYPVERDISSIDFENVWKPIFLDLTVTENDLVELTADVVIIGSGAGGGVVAAELAKAGLKVIVLEKGKYYAPADLSHEERESFNSLYENRGVLQSDNGSILILAGSTFGGGTYVNWSASLRPPQSLRNEWGIRHKLSRFQTQDFEDSVNAVCNRSGVRIDASIPHNPSNKILLDGSAKLGLAAAEIPQNTDGKPHKCGFCGLGCPYAEKLGTHMTFLKDAAETNNTSFIQDCFVEKILHAKGVVTGVQARTSGNNTRIKISCKTVVSSAGSLNTPCLLTRSGLANKNIGRNLRLHPAAFIRGVFPSRNINPHVGPIMTSINTSLANRNNSEYGARIEIPYMLPGLFSVVNSYNNSFDMKRKMLQYPQSCNMVILTRDLDSKASIYEDKDGKLIVSFTLGKEDEQAMIEGMITAAKIMLVEGAQEIDSSQIGFESLKLDADELKDPLNCAKTKLFLKKVAEVGMKKKLVGSAHQMGSARMGASPETSVVDPDGQSWEVKGLYVADASVFPTASGNADVILKSQLYCMATSDCCRALGVAVVVVGEKRERAAVVVVSGMGMRECGQQSCPGRSIDDRDKKNRINSDHGFATVVCCGAQLVASVSLELGEQVIKKESIPDDSLFAMAAATALPAGPLLWHTLGLVLASPQVSGVRSEYFNVPVLQDLPIPDVSTVSISSKYSVSQLASIGRTLATEAAATAYSKPDLLAQNKGSSGYEWVRCLHTENGCTALKTTSYANNSSE
ncbi:hypothetical protein HK100_001081 [Physocladia obscura]|uniref:Long-chain-alcohol oxidase n=1 Tax=Physocladia obscura TaxID=109957 RepID=A0AAD5XF42_9FUNG|nr:hypothetical protein HK100_001081 [Physocladia obscura]